MVNIGPRPGREPQMTTRAGVDMSPRQNPTGMGGPTFRALRMGNLVLHSIAEDGAVLVREKLRPHDVDGTVSEELEKHYLPGRDEKNRLIKFGFYAELDGRPAGLCVLGVNHWPNRRGYTGAFTLPNMRGKGVAPRSKPALFHLGFTLLGLNRIETGIAASNSSSIRSVEKTAGFLFEGRLRQYVRQDNGAFEDQLRYAILREDWERLYDPDEIDVLD